MRIRTIALCLTLSLPACAETFIDLYGMNPADSNRILNKYSSRILVIETGLTSALYSIINGADANQRPTLLLNQKKKLLREIKQAEGLDFVDIQTIHYSDSSNDYTTIDVVEKNQPARLKLVSPPIKYKHVASKDDLIHTMMIYLDVSMKLILTHKVEGSVTACPVYHCLVDFKHPTLKPYLALFNQGAVKDKPLILETLAHDPDPERRSAAVYLVGHFRDPHEIIAVLLPYVNDSNEGVRNNTMRVLGATMEKSRITTIDATPFITLLNSPSVTDRNKSLFVLLSLSESRFNQKRIIQEGHDQLLALLRLKQPNNHEMAYQLLKKISGEKYKSNDIAAWENWLSHAQKKSG